MYGCAHACTVPCDGLVSRPGSIPFNNWNLDQNKMVMTSAWMSHTLGFGISRIQKDWKSVLDMLSACNINLRGCAAASCSYKFNQSFFWFIFHLHNWHFIITSMIFQKDSLNNQRHLFKNDKKNVRNMCKFILLKLKWIFFSRLWQRNTPQCTEWGHYK